MLTAPSSTYQSKASHSRLLASRFPERVNVIKACEMLLKDKQYDFVNFNAKEPSKIKLYQHLVNRFAAKFNLTSQTPKEMEDYIGTVAKRLFQSGKVFFLFHK